MDNLITVAPETDLFICECNDFFQKDYDGHMDYETLKDKLHLLDTKQIILNHAGPEMLQNQDKVDLTLAYDGMAIQI